MKSPRWSGPRTWPAGAKPQSTVVTSFRPRRVQREAPGATLYLCSFAGPRPAGREFGGKTRSAGGHHPDYLSGNGAGTPCAEPDKRWSAPMTTTAANTAATAPPVPSLPDDAARWAAVERRDRAADGAFVYAVATTGVYCRPSCPARRARRGERQLPPDPRGGRGAPGSAPAGAAVPKAPAPPSARRRASPRPAGRSSARWRTGTPCRSPSSPPRPACRGSTSTACSRRWPGSRRRSTRRRAAPGWRVASSTGTGASPRPSTGPATTRRAASTRPRPPGSA